MKVNVIGGGPAGLYFAILYKKAWPQARITVYERNRPDDTFGFGVVFSDQTLETFQKYDLESYRSITENFAYWDDIEIHFKGMTRRIGGNGFCGCSRATLLQLLHQRAQALGVELKFQTDVTDIDAAMRDADLVIAADGINSRVRETFKDHFKPHVDLRPNRFTWMGSTKPLDAFTFYFKETKYGIVIVHAYQYEPGRSTWIFETDPDTFAKFGLDPLDEPGTAKLMEELFAEELQGHKLIINRSMWRNFPAIRCERWVYENCVIVGDAKATAHFSIGSGTKLAMEDAIGLYEAFRKAGSTNVQAALAYYETNRREEVEKTQHSADVSLVWFEHVKRFWNMDPTRFIFGLMTRSKAITYDNLALRAPDIVNDIDHLVANETKALGFDVDTKKPVPPMFQPFQLRGMTVPNRVVVSPMCQYSAKDGLPNDWHLVHLGSRAIGGAGLVFTEMTDVSADARISPGCTGLYNDEQEAAWKRIVDFVHSNSAAKICMQLGHAGRKGATKLSWEGNDEPLESGAWPIISASPLPYYPNSQVPREMTRADMDKTIADYVAAVKRAERAGFDMIELHAAHGYLLASFISPITNKRTDEYGGSLENRMRFPLDVFKAMRKAWPDDKPMSVRISATDWIDGGVTGDDAVKIAKMFEEHGCDLIDVSTGQTDPASSPVYGRMYQTPFSDQIRNEAGIATMAVGAITTADQVNTIVAAARADLVALARPHLMNPSFTMQAAAWYGADDIYCQPQYLSGRDQIFRNAAREREEMTELKRKAKPKPQIDSWKQAAE
ncbi:bifunctional salicylyl-CoA 5-hydroxylase/oxidoreductase [Pseudorhodoplanes sinuspersici]|uniref:Oxidoreductase n=1 Tax=Pseudorhodoplanes sinuspersici TaxID=1235591 RepID=A0A1W6ZPR8_9HYPH|nr:bifunctional salicylyl-CoA 5-hydroxylase/oxidoreductase [Pseudorhodoplanes sinuspersici]ARP99359.1 oxidoreductase [Pseudorhodoplanes sinuspersici]RKE70292.1 anthraniloyl-CoA monooxygenase [Pseudorhodoplanes sinuspersici]